MNKKTLTNATNQTKLISREIEACKDKVSSVITATDDDNNDGVIA